MLNARIATIEQVGSDHVCFRETGILTKVTFADDGQFTKEDSAGFFGRFAGKAAAIASSEKREGYFIAVDVIHEDR
jgi:hypothetical protein